MTTSTPWTGIRKIAFVPVFRTVTLPDPPDQIPDRWADKILARALYDPQPDLGDRSLRAWVRAASSGRADLAAVVLPMQTLGRARVEADDLEGQLGDSLRSQGFHAAILVMLGGVGAGTNRGFWSRTVMLEGNGTWLMELLHGLTGFKDLYPFSNDTDPSSRAMGSFDEMAGAGQTHPSAYTKNEFGWLDESAMPLHAGASGQHVLQHLSLPLPPSGDRVAAVRIGDTVPYTIVESRWRTDQFDSGISSQGVIAYRVQTKDPTVQDRPGGKLPLYLQTQVAVQPGQSVALDNGVTLTVVEARPDGHVVRIDDSGLHHLDRTATTGAAAAAGPPCSLVLPAHGLENLAFAGGNGHQHEVWRDPLRQGTTDLTANAGAPSGRGNPWTYFDPAGNQVVLVFRGTDNRVRSLYWMFGQVGHDDLTGAIGAPAAAGDPAGWFSTHDGFHHVVYGSGNGHLHELWWQGQGGVGHGDLTAAANAVAAAGDPWPWYDAGRATNIVAFRGKDSRIRSLYWGPDGAVGQDDLSGTAGTPSAKGDPMAWYTSSEDAHRVTYRGTNDHVYELLWIGVAPVLGRDLTALSGAPNAAADPSGGYNAADNTQHVFFRSSDGHLHELWWFVGDPVVHRGDLTAAFGAPAAVDRPTYWATPTAPHHHLAYRGTDNHLHELLW